VKDFTNLTEIKKIDPQNAFGSTELMVEQIKVAWNEVSKLDIPKNLSQIKSIIFCGMGASIYGALVTKALFGNEMPYPIEMISDYHLPGYVDNNTLVVLTSYSGTTEEVLSCAEEAKLKRAKIIVLTKGGPLAEFARNNNIPSYIFDGKLNPSSTPRLGNGYTILGLIGLLNKVGIIEVEEKEMADAITRLGEKIKEIKSKAASDFEMFYNKIPIIFAAEHLSGNGLILRNQFNETSKTFSSFFLIPDLNHHLMEGLQFPNNPPLHFIVLNSPNYSPKIKKRVELTIDVVKKNNQAVFEFTTEGQTLYDDVLEVLMYGSFLTLYLGLMYDQNPASNPWVDYFKDKLKSAK